eukprot:scaffold102793_cov50-Prasinocladus_malaysianus.AAC.3
MALQETSRILWSVLETAATVKTLVKYLHTALLRVPYSRWNKMLKCGLELNESARSKARVRMRRLDMCCSLD